MRPVFFTDRDLGNRFPALLVAAGISVERHSAPANFVATMPRIAAFLDRHERPFIARVYRPTPSDLAKRRKPIGRIELWKGG